MVTVAVVVVACPSSSPSLMSTPSSVDDTGLNNAVGMGYHLILGSAKMTSSSALRRSKAAVMDSSAMTCSTAKPMIPLDPGGGLVVRYLTMISSGMNQSPSELGLGDWLVEVVVWVSERVRWR